MTDEDPLDRAWIELDASWDDDGAHERFLSLGDALDRLPEVARRYREQKDAGGARAAEAERRLGALTARALARIAQTPRTTKLERRPLEWVALGVSVALATAALYQMLRVM